jgi:MFS family permease
VHSWRWALGLLTIVNLLNYLDRYVVSALVESLRASELKITDTQAGLLMTSFLLVYTFSSPFFGNIADKGNRPRTMSIGIALWSLATAAAGFAQSFTSLFISRAVVGIGEAAYGTIAPTLIMDKVEAKSHGRAFALFYLAIPVGAALGYVIGGLVDAHFGWRAAFFVAGVPGLICAVMVWNLPDRGPTKSHAAAKSSTSIASTITSYATLLKQRTYRNLVIGYALNTFGMGALAFWMPSFLERVHGLPREAATTHFGAVVVGTGIVGTLIGGWLSDRWSRTNPAAPIWIGGLACLLGAPLIALALQPVPILPFWPLVIAAELLIFMATGPINVAIIKAAPEHLRGAGVALSILLIHIFGDVPSPPLVGWISDGVGLATGIILVPISIGMGSLFWIREAFYK